MKKGIILLIILLPLIQAVAQLPDATQIMNKSSDLVMKGSMSSDIALTITEKGGAIRKRTISMVTKSYPDGSEKRLIRFIEPAVVRGTTILILDNKILQDEMWIYLPALKKTRKIVSSEKRSSFMSSEFSNFDISAPTLTDFTYKHLPGSGDNNKWIISSTPINKEKQDEYGYSTKVSYINSATWQVEKMDYYNIDNQLFKVMEILNIQPLDNGTYIIKNMTATNLRTGRSSEILLDKIVTNTKIEDSVFSLENIEK
jgi:hypothetical protein